MIFVFRYGNINLSMFTSLANAKDNSVLPLFYVKKLFYFENMFSFGLYSRIRSSGDYVSSPLKG